MTENITRDKIAKDFSLPGLGQKFHFFFNRGNLLLFLGIITRVPVS